MSVFSHLLTGDSAAFYANVADDVVWTVMGENHPLAGRYISKDQFLRESYDRVGKVLDAPMKLAVRSVILEGDWAVVELVGQGGRLKSGREYNNTYSWTTRWNDGLKIVEVRAYLDTAMLKEALANNE
ncbi:hypothetical protein AOQ84DRAFT_384117 [Glonium stellatum]|uniref:SnoaL-like domain-containing protein n=1 Tax=Glonium stellatum TaxID=574774 RepID=A0A8E2FDT1_9PEZI|nr:hypothetical protein AOQ84DRAFT_384117 [Glonium stellatum]